MRCSEARNLIPLLVMELIDDGSKRALIEEHLAACPECAKLHRQHLELDDHLTAELSTCDPPPRGSFLKARNLIQGELRRAEYRRRYSFWNALKRRSRPVAALGAFSLVLGMFLGQPVVYSEPVGTSVTLPLNEKQSGSLDIARASSLLSTFPEFRRGDVSYELVRRGDSLRLTIEGDDGGCAPRVASRLAFVIPEVDRVNAEYHTIVSDGLASRYALWTGRRDSHAAERQQERLQATLAGLDAWELAKLPEAQRALRDSYVETLMASGIKPYIITQEENQSRLWWQDGSQVLVSSEPMSARVKTTFACAEGFDHGLFGGTRKPYEALVLDRELDSALSGDAGLDVAEQALMRRAEAIGLTDCNLELNVGRPVGTVQMRMDDSGLFATQATTRGGGFDFTLGVEPLQEDAYLRFLRSIPRYKVRVEKQERFPQKIYSVVRQSELNELADNRLDPDAYAKTLQERMRNAGIGSDTVFVYRMETDKAHVEIRCYDGRTDVKTYPILDSTRPARDLREIRLYQDSGECCVFSMTGNNQSPRPFSFYGPVDSWPQLALLPFSEPERIHSSDMEAIYGRGISAPHPTDSGDWTMPVDHALKDELGRIRLMVPDREQTQVFEISSSGVQSRTENSLDQALQLFGGDRDWTYADSGWLAFSAPEGWTVNLDHDLVVTNGHRHAMLLSRAQLYSLRDHTIADNSLPGLSERMTTNLVNGACSLDSLAIVVARDEALPLMLEINGVTPTFRELDEDLLLSQDPAE